MYDFLADCSADRWGVNCSMPCICPANTTERCDNVLGTCYCKTGWAGSQCNQDVDECTRSPSPCPTLSKCTNTIGAFTCLCEDGYILNLNSSICESKYTFIFGVIYWEGLIKALNSNILKTVMLETLSQKDMFFLVYEFFFLP